MFSYTGDPSVSDTAAVRFELHDTDPAAYLLADEELAWCIVQETGAVAGTPATITTPNLYRAGARAMESLSRLFLMQADQQIGTLKTTYTKQADQYATRAEELRAKASAMNAPYAGGLSISEKQAFRQNTDAVNPLFTRAQWDNPRAGNVTGYSLQDFGPAVP